MRRTAWTAADGVGATEWLEMGGEKKPLVMSDLGCADGCGRQMGAENCADGCGRRGCKGVAGNGWGEEGAGDERPWLRGRLRTANGCGELRGWLRTAWVQRSGWKWVGRRERKGKDGKGRDRKGKEGTGRERKGKDGKGRKREGKGRERKGKEGDGKGRERNGADGCGRPGCKGVAGNGWGGEAAGDERAWLRGRLRTGNGCGEVRGRLWMARVQRWLEMGGEKKPLVMSDLGCADGCGRQMGAENCVDGCGQRRCNGVAGNGWGEEAAGDERPWLRGRLRTANGCGEPARTAADGVGARGWLEMGGEKKPLVMSDLGCADGCGRQMGAENCVDGCGRRGCNGVAGNGWGEEAAGDERPWMRGRLRTANGCRELRGPLRTAWVQGGGWKWGEEAAGDERAWLRGRLRTANGCGRTAWTANGCGELRGRLRTAWVQRSGWKWAGRRSRW